MIVAVCGAFIFVFVNYSCCRLIYSFCVVPKMMTHILNHEPALLHQDCLLFTAGKYVVYSKSDRTNATRQYTIQYKHQRRRPLIL